MKINLIALGTKMPEWIESGYHTYAKRIRTPWQLTLTELNIPKRHKHADIAALKAQEAQALLQASKNSTMRIALDEHGKQHNTQSMANTLNRLSQNHSSIDVLIGGPDGLSSEILDTSQLHWSLSSLTFPHHLVRIIMAEQLYRAISLINNHPYHRGTE